MFCKKTQETPVKSEPAKEASEPKKVSVWDRFDAAERQRRIDEFIAADKEYSDSEYEALPSIADRGDYCPRCDQGSSRQHVATVEAQTTTYEIVVREVDGDLVLSRSLNWTSAMRSLDWYPYYPSRVLGPTLTTSTRMLLTVTCECGKSLRYRPLEEA